jgi:hypothetical protein
MFDIWKNIDEDIELLDGLMEKAKDTREIISISGCRKRLVKFKDSNKKESKQIADYKADRDFIGEFLLIHGVPRVDVDLILKGLEKDYKNVKIQEPTLDEETKKTIETIRLLDQRKAKSKSSYEISRLLDSKRQLLELIINKIPKAEISVDYEYTGKALRQYLDKEELPEPTVIKMIWALEDSINGPRPHVIKPYPRPSEKWNNETLESELE